MKVLTLHLKKKWFDMIKSGVKKEEYREFNEFWIKRLTWTNRYSKEQRNPFNGTILFDRLVFTLGYPKKYNKKTPPGIQKSKNPH